MEGIKNYLEVLRNFEDHFEILALYWDQDNRKSKCWTELEVVRVGKQKIKHMLKEITDQMGKRWKTNSWILKRRIYRVNGNHRKTHFCEGGKKKYKVNCKE